MQIENRSADRRSEPVALPRLIDIETLAAQLGDSIRHLRRLIAEDRIPYIKVGHFIRFDPAEISRWLSSHARNSFDSVRESRSRSA